MDHVPQLMDLISLVFWYAIAFHSHPTRTSTEAQLSIVLPSPFLWLLFNVNGRMNGCSWPIKRPALLKSLDD